MHTVIETTAFLRQAKAAGMSEDERSELVAFIAANPDAGVVMPGCGGARKVRFARAGGGKSGGYRVVSYFIGPTCPVFLLTVFPKNMKSNLTKSEQNDFSIVCKVLVASLGEA